MLRGIVLALLLTVGLWTDCALSDDNSLCGDAKVEADARVAACTKLLASNSRDEHATSRIFVSRGAAYLRKKDPDHALADYGEAITHDGDNANAFLQRGKLYWTKLEYELAFENLDHAIRLAPIPEHFVARGSMHVAILQSDPAIADFTQAIVLNPRSVEAYRCRAVAYSQKKEFDLAITDYDQILLISPIDRRAMIARHNTRDAKGENLKDMGDYGRMIVARIQSQKAYPRLATREKPEGTTRIIFIVGREGNLMSSSVKISSGSDVLDQEALDTVRRAQPFPPFPNSGKESEEYSISMVFRALSLYQFQ